MTSERPRVSDATLLRYIKVSELGWLDPLLLDLRDAREENACLVEQILSRKPEAVEADLQRVMAENAELRAALATARTVLCRWCKAGDPISLDDDGVDRKGEYHVFAGGCRRCEADFLQAFVPGRKGQPVHTWAGDPFRALAPDTAEGVPEHMPTMPEQKASPPNPSPADLADQRFNAVWSVIKRWDIRAPWYSGYCGATGTHVMAILAALTAAQGGQS